MYIELDGETSRELWENLLDLVCSACESKNKNDGHEFPLLISKSCKGLIKVVDLGKGNTGGNQYYKDAEIEKLKLEIEELKNKN